MRAGIAARLSLHDREIGAIRKLLLAGMKMLAQIQKAHREMQKAGKETDRRLDRLAAERKAMRKDLREPAVD